MIISQIKLLANSEVSITVFILNLKVNGKDKHIKQCNIIFQVSFEIYQHIEEICLLNLKPEICSPIYGNEFKHEFDIQIEATLDPALLPTLAKNATNAEEAAAYLQQLSQEQPDHPILSTYSWYALEVKQKQDQGETKYTTLWKYLNPSLITADGIDPEKMNEAMNNFAKEWADTNGSVISEDVITQAIEEINEGITQTFEELTNSFSEMTEEIVSETMAEMNSAFEELADSFSELSIDLEKENIFEAIIDFFKAEEWQFQIIQEQQTLRLIFKGNNGQWDCYARAREKQQQFVFYSICPIKILDSKIQAIAEFIARANYGMIIGNFELNFTNGEIRYKTSIDVQGDLISSALIKQVVYANVTMMDEYLPGILAVVDKDVSSAEAIAEIEN
ncbi:MAG: YbjN domain-containing protein [Moorea sp. SIO2B7]|nr:YbjN domain-containing protein [Moorena sp. SIO2B7]